METKTVTPVIPLVKKQDTFKLIVTKELEKKIRFLCQRQPDNEWSGTLFYEPEGNFEDGSLVIKCVDVCLMDIGSSAYTEFDMSPEVISYAVEHDLIGVQMGLIHSHDKMATFFSGTDTSTLKEEGLDRNHFVSLIVNNAGSYTAGITRRVKSTKNIDETYSYESFEGESVNKGKSYTVESEELEWFNLDIIIEKDNDMEKELDARLEEIKKIKAAKPKQPVYNGYPMYPQGKTQVNKSTETKTFSHNVVQSKQKELPFEELEDIDYNYSHFPKDEIKSYVLQLITGSIIIPNESKIEPYKWAMNMSALFDKRFGKGNIGFLAFKSWADSYIEFICWNAYNYDLEAMGYTEDDMAAICASDIISELNLLPKNKYIDEYIDLLMTYMK